VGISGEFSKLGREVKNFPRVRVGKQTYKFSRLIFNRLSIEVLAEKYPKCLLKIFFDLKLAGLLYNVL